MVKLISFLIGFHYRQGLKTTTKYEVKEVKRNEEDKDEKHIGKLRLQRTQR